MMAPTPVYRPGRAEILERAAIRLRSVAAKYRADSPQVMTVLLHYGQILEDFDREREDLRTTMLPTTPPARH